MHVIPSFEVNLFTISFISLPSLQADLQSKK